MPASRLLQIVVQASRLLKIVVQASRLQVLQIAVPVQASRLHHQAQPIKNGE